jgi:hypothetical protein
MRVALLACWYVTRPRMGRTQIFALPERWQHCLCTVYDMTLKTDAFLLVTLHCYWNILMVDQSTLLALMLCSSHPARTLLHGYEGACL